MVRSTELKKYILYGPDSLEERGKMYLQAQELKEIITGLLFIHGDSLSISEIANGLEQDTSIIREVVKNLEVELNAQNFGLQITHVAGGIQLTTKPKLKPYLDNFYGGETKRRLSRAALETLAVVAYRQPVTRVEIEEIRGVKVDKVLYSLIEKELIQYTGKKDVPGKPLLFGTTEKFLQYFGLNKLEDLPHPDEFPSSLFDHTENKTQET